MADTVRTHSELDALFADNAAGDISAQDLRDGFQSVDPELHGVFNVERYGADMTGASNSQTAVDDALTAISSAGGGTLYIPPGTLLVDQIYIGRTGNQGNATANIKGAGRGVSIIKGEGTTAGAILLVENPNTYYGQRLAFFEDFSITGDGSSYAPGRYGIQLDKARGQTFNRIGIYDTLDSCIFGGNTTSPQTTTEDNQHFTLFHDISLSNPKEAHTYNRPMVELVSWNQGVLFDHVVLFGSSSWPSGDNRRCAAIGAFYLHPATNALWNASDVYAPDTVTFRNIVGQSIYASATGVGRFMTLDDAYNVSVDGLRLFDSAFDFEHLIEVKNTITASHAGYRRNGHRFRNIDGTAMATDQLIYLNDADRCFIEIGRNHGVLIGSGSRDNVIVQIPGPGARITSNWGNAGITVDNWGVTDSSGNDSNYVTSYVSAGASTPRDSFLGVPRLASVDPTDITQGNTIPAGALFFDEDTNKLKVYNGSTWETVTSS